MRYYDKKALSKSGVTLKGTNHLKKFLTENQIAVHVWNPDEEDFETSRVDEATGMTEDQMSTANAEQVAVSSLPAKLADYFVGRTVEFGYTVGYDRHETLRKGDVTSWKSNVSKPSFRVDKEGVLYFNLYTTCGCRIEINVEPDTDKKVGNLHFLKNDFLLVGLHVNHYDMTASAKDFLVHFGRK